jgi:hypothetical protein
LDTVQGIEKMSYQDPDLQKPAASEEHPVFSEDPVFQPPVKLKHSGPGIASFIMSLVSLIGYVILAITVINVLAHFSEYQRMDPEAATQQVVSFPAIVVHKRSALCTPKRDKAKYTTRLSAQVAGFLAFSSNLAMNNPTIFDRITRCTSTYPSHNLS